MHVKVDRLGMPGLRRLSTGVLGQAVGDRFRVVGSTAGFEKQATVRHNEPRVSYVAVVGPSLVGLAAARPVLPDDKLRTPLSQRLVSARAEHLVHRVCPSKSDDAGSFHGWRGEYQKYRANEGFSDTNYDPYRSIENISGRIAATAVDLVGHAQ